MVWHEGKLKRKKVDGQTSNKEHLKYLEMRGTLGKFDWAWLSPWQSVI
jgi:hypothetical protein